MSDSLPWFRVDNAMVDHPRTHALCDLLGEPLAGWYVIRLWSWTMRYAAHGRLSNGARTALETACGWRGQAGGLVDALLAVGWLETDDSGCLEVHDWEEHQGAAVAKAQKDAERKRAVREEARRRRGDGAETARAVSAAGAGTRRDETRRDEETTHVADEPRPLLEVVDQPSSAVLDVWECWRQECRHPRAVLTRTRRRLIEARLKDYPAGRLQAAILGCSRSPWHRGENERRIRYDSLELILRDAEHIERFESMHKGAA